MAGRAGFLCGFLYLHIGNVVRSMSQARILYLLKLLSEETDQDTGITLHQIKNRLCEQATDRVWDEQRLRADLSFIQWLCDKGEMPFRLEQTTGPHNEYRYRLYRPKFGLNEARLVFDSISTSQFLSDLQKRELLSQMEGFLSKREIRSLKQRVQSRSVSMTSTDLPQKLKTIYTAIEQHRCLQCDYFKYGVDGKKRLDKQYRELRPIQVIFANGHYYLSAINPSGGNRSEHKYRIDRMERIKEDRGIWLPIKQGDLSYGQFDMFGREQLMVVRLRIHRTLMDMAVEVLGPGALFCADEDPDWSRVTAEVEISDGFYRWVLRQAGKLEVLAPEEIRQNVREKLQAMLENYL